jgi:hypothetical protein
MNEEGDSDDKVITVRLPKKDLDMVRKIIERERAMSWFGSWLRTGLLWALMGFATLFLGLWDWIKNALYSAGTH